MIKKNEENKAPPFFLRTKEALTIVMKNIPISGGNPWK
jgi:hypothetical protein